jgi:hypothetical protein
MPNEPEQLVTARNGQYQLGSLPKRNHPVKYMYIQDLTPYIYLNREPDGKVLAVGWWDAEHEFIKGALPKGVLERFIALCFKPINQTRGFHPSPFLKSVSLGYPVEHHGQKMLLGSAEIRVSGLEGKCYAAPNLIYHYMKDCDYLPPQEFLDALMNNMK